jgi:hypothetical protein
VERSARSSVWHGIQLLGFDLPPASRHPQDATSATRSAASFVPSPGPSQRRGRPPGAFLSIALERVALLQENSCCSTACASISDAVARLDRFQATRTRGSTTAAQVEILGPRWPIQPSRCDGLLPQGRPNRERRARACHEHERPRGGLCRIPPRVLRRAPRAPQWLVSRRPSASARPGAVLIPSMITRHDIPIDPPPTNAKCIRAPPPISWPGKEPR